MIIRAAFIICLTAISSSLAFGCVNGLMTKLKSGYIIYEEKEGLTVPRGHSFWDHEEGLVAAAEELDSLYNATKDLDYLTDKGVILIIQRQFKSAIELYLEIERLQPNRYTTASNIGTAYELAGENEKALRWIKRAVEIDSTSHFNSEWIHVNILEAKIKGEEYYTTSFLLNTDFGDYKVPTSSKNSKELKALSEALYFQLNERMSFVQPKEKIVAQLLFDLGNLAFLTGNYHDAVADYEIAKTYGFKGTLIADRLKAAEGAARTLVMPPSSGASNSYFGFILIGAAGIIIAGVFYKKWREDRS